MNIRDLSLKTFTILAISALPSTATSLVLGEFYQMDPTNRVWYLGGIYDANVIDYRGNGERSECLQAMGLEGFTQLVSKFVVALPEDPNSKERKVFDKLNVAVVAALEVDKTCQNWKRQNPKKTK